MPAFIEAWLCAKHLLAGLPDLSSSHQWEVSLHHQPLPHFRGDSRMQRGCWGINPSQPKSGVHALFSVPLLFCSMSCCRSEAKLTGPVATSVGADSRISGSLPGLRSPGRNICLLSRQLALLSFNCSAIATSLGGR